MRTSFKYWIAFWGELRTIIIALRRMAKLNWIHHVNSKTKILKYNFFLSAREPGDWVCAKDDTRIYISQLGNMRCSKSGGSGYAHSGKIISWRFDCGNHGKHPYTRYQHADYQGFTYAVSQALQFSGSAESEWIAALVLELGKQYGYEKAVLLLTQNSELFVLLITSKNIFAP